MTVEQEPGALGARTVSGEPVPRGAYPFEDAPPPGPPADPPPAAPPPPFTHNLLASVVAAIVVSVAVVLVLWYALIKPNIKDEAQNQVAARLGGGAVSSSSGSVSGQLPVATTPLPATTPAAPVGGGGALGDPADGRLSVQTAPGTSTSATNPPQGSLVKVGGNSVLSITDLVIGNPQGDTGTLEVRRNGAPLLSFQLADFRNTDYHFVAPVTFRAGDILQLYVACSQAGAAQPGGAAPTQCDESLYYDGYQKTLKP